MNSLSDLTYQIKVEYTNDNGSTVIISKQIEQNGIETTSTQVGDVCITEKTINGRILSGKLMNNELCCGYQYNYDGNRENYLININEEIPLDKSIPLINKTKMNSDFLVAKMTFLCALKKHYDVISLQNNAINLYKTVSASNNSNTYNIEQNILIAKSKNIDTFEEIKNESIYRIDRNFIIEDNLSSDNNNIYDQMLYNYLKSNLKDLLMIIEKNPNNSKALNAIISSIQNTEATL